jgi:hypothetical protein
MARLNFRVRPSTSVVQFYEIGLHATAEVTPCGGQPFDSRVPSSTPRDFVPLAVFGAPFGGGSAESGITYVCGAKWAKGPQPQGPEA